jgi:hypothetical protein
MDGIFTKILHSTEYVTMNGINLTFPIWNNGDIVSNFTHYQNNNHNIRYIKCIKSYNLQLIQDFCSLETKLLTYYSLLNKCDKLPDLSLSKQLNNSQIRVYSTIILPSISTFVIKISGIWESIDKIGIAYKIIELPNNNVL